VGRRRTPEQILAEGFHCRFNSLRTLSDNVKCSQNIHFIGHSLGTLLNRYACDYLHAPGHWNAAKTQPHVTLLDEAELTGVSDVQVVRSSLQAAKQAASDELESLNTLRGSIVSEASFSANLAFQITVSAITSGIASTRKNWKDPVPEAAGFVDNYQSAVGFTRSDALNICLTAATINPVAAHAYAYNWYSDSIEKRGVSPVGFSLATASGPVNSPFDPLYAKGNIFLQSVSIFRDEMAFTQISESYFGECAARHLAAAPVLAKLKPVEDTVIAGLDLADKAKAGVKILVVDAKVLVDQGIEFVGDVKETTKEKVGNYIDSQIDETVGYLKNMTSAINLRVEDYFRKTYRYSLFGSREISARRTKGVGVQGPGVWLKVDVPADAVLMAFDFGIVGDPIEDVLSMAVNGNNEFQMPAKFLKSGVIQSSDLFDISSLAGQEVEIYFGFNGGTSTGEAIFEGLRFMTLQLPRVVITPSANPEQLDLSWPVAASGWVLQESPDLRDSSWLPVELPDELLLEEGILSISVTPEVEGGGKRFYRLKREE